MLIINTDSGVVLINIVLIGLTYYYSSPIVSRSGEYFVGGETGMAIPGTACTAKSVGISVDVNAYEPHIIAGSMAHMIGHNLGMGHDDKSAYTHVHYSCCTTVNNNNNIRGIGIFRVILK